MFVRAVNELHKLAGYVSKVIETAITLSLIVLLSLILYEVGGRYIFHVSTPWIPEGVGFLLAFIGFAGSSCLVHNRSLLSITFVRDKLPPIAEILLDISIWILFMVYMRIFVVYGLQFAAAAARQLTPSGAISLSQARMIVPIGGGLIFFQCFVNLCQEVVKLFTFRTHPLEEKDYKPKELL